MTHLKQYLILCLLVIFSCSKDYIEPDISGVKINLVSPANNLTTSILTHTFKWDTFEDATLFNLQVVSGTIDHPKILVLDTNILTTSYTTTLALGEYYWMVKAFNSVYETAYSNYNLTLSNDSTTDITNQIIVLTTPLNSSYTNTMFVNFTWQNNPYAKDYRVEIYAPNINGSIIGSPVTTTNNSLDYSFTSEGSFNWQVRGQNATSNTLFSTFVLNIDTTVPNKPTLMEPTNGVVVSDTSVFFSWTYPVDTGSPITDSIYIYSDSSLTLLYRAAASIIKQYEDTLSAGTYYWQVRSSDAAGNRGLLSNTFTFSR